MFIYCTTGRQFNSSPRTYPQLLLNPLLLLHLHIHPVPHVLQVTQLLLTELDQQLDPVAMETCTQHEQYKTHIKHAWVCVKHIWVSVSWIHGTRKEHIRVDSYTKQTLLKRHTEHVIQNMSYRRHIVYMYLHHIGQVCNTCYYASLKF